MFQTRKAKRESVRPSGFACPSLTRVWHSPRSELDQQKWDRAQYKSPHLIFLFLICATNPLNLYLQVQLYIFNSSVMLQETYYEIDMDCMADMEKVQKTWLTLALSPHRPSRLGTTGHLMWHLTCLKVRCFCWQVKRFQWGGKLIFQRV